MANKTFSEQLKNIRSANRLDAQDVIEAIASNWQPLPTDESGVIGGTGLIGNNLFFIIGLIRGKDLNSRIKNNFGAVRYSGYQQTLQFIEFAKEKKIPILTLIDMPGADASVDSEKNGQAGLIAKTMFEMGQYNQPTIAVILSEGHSGGALAFANTSKLIMFEQAIFNVASPEAVNAILKTNTNSEEFSKFQPMTAHRLVDYGITDEIVHEDQPVKQQLQELQIAISNQYQLIHSQHQQAKISYAQMRQDKLQNIVNLAIIKKR